MEENEDSFMKFTRIVEANIQDNSMQDSLVPLQQKYSNTEKKNLSAMDNSALKYNIQTTQTKSPLCDSRSAHKTPLKEDETTMSSNNVSASKKQQNDYTSLRVLDIKPSHPMILKLSENYVISSASPHVEYNINKDHFLLSENTNNENHSEDNKCQECTDSNNIKEAECFQDGNAKANSTCQTKIHTVLPTSPECKTVLIEEGQHANDVGNNATRVSSNTTIVGDTIAFCVRPISDTENIPITTGSAITITSKYSERKPHGSNRSDLHYLPPQDVEDCLITDTQFQCASGNGVSNMKRRSSELEQADEITSSPKKQCITTGDKNKPLSATNSPGKANVTIRRGSRYERNKVSPSFKENDIKIEDFFSENNKKRDKSVVIGNAELSKGVKSINKLHCSLSNSKWGEKSDAISQSRYDKKNTSVKKDADQSAEGMEISSTTGNKFSLLEPASCNEEKTSWCHNERPSITHDSSVPSTGKSNSINNYQTTFGATECFPAQALHVPNKATTLGSLPAKSEEIRQNVSWDNSLLDCKMGDGNLSTETRLTRARRKIRVVDIDSTSNYLISIRERDFLSKSCLVNDCDNICLKQSVRENEILNTGKYIESQQFNAENSVERPPVDVEVLNGSSEVNDSQEPTPNMAQDSHSVTNKTQDCFSVAQGNEQHTPSLDRNQVLPLVGLSASDRAVAASSSPVSSGVMCVKMCSQPMKCVVELASTADVIINGVRHMDNASSLPTSSQNSKCDSFSNEIVVHSMKLHSAAIKTTSVNEKRELIKIKAQEEKLTSSMKNKCREIENIITSKAESLEVLWNIRSLTQFQWIMSFLNDTLRLYIHFDKPAEDGIIEDLDFISYLKGKADEDAKFVHFVLLKKFSKDKLKALCKGVEEVPELLEKISVAVRKMVAFLYEFQKVHMLYNMEMFGTSVSFNIMSYKLRIWFKVNIDLSNWEKIVKDNITITQKFGQVEELEIKSLATGVKKNCCFLENYFKAIRQYMKILERFGC